MDTLPSMQNGCRLVLASRSKRGSDHYIGEAATNDPAAAENEGLRREVAGREDHDRREGPHGLSKNSWVNV
jgi:hypothetical protein